MTDKKDEALRLAANINPFGSVENARARDAAREALEQPQCDRCGKPLGPEGHIHTCTPKPQPQQEPVADGWSVFNIGAEVASGLSLSEALEYMTPARIERGWSAVCVLDKGNPPNTNPPRREWDYDALYDAWHAVGADCAGLRWDDFVAKLKERNHD